MPWEHRARPEAQPRPADQQPVSPSSRPGRRISEQELAEIAKANRLFVANAQRDAERHLLKDHQPAHYAKPVTEDLGLCASCGSPIDAGQHIVTFVIAGQAAAVHQGCATAYHSKRLHLL